MGRKVEETMLYVATKWAKSMTTLTVEATYIPTSKNRPCCDFFQRSDFRYNGNNTLHLGRDTKNIHYTQRFGCSKNKMTTLRIESNMCSRS